MNFNPKLRALAAKTLAHARTGAVPPRVRESARKILDGSGSPADAQAIYDFWGVVKTDRSQMRRDAGAISGALGKVGNYANLIGTISQGGLAGAGAGVGLLNTVAGDAEKLAKSEVIKRAVERATEAYYNGPKKGKIVDALMAAVSLKSIFSKSSGSGMKPQTFVGEIVEEANFGRKALGLRQKLLGAPRQEIVAGDFYGPPRVDSKLAAERILYGVRGAAGWAAARLRLAGAYGAAAYAGGYVGNTFGSLAAGNVNIEKRRQLNQETNLALSDSSVNPHRQQLARLNFLSADNRLHGWGAIPLVGDFFARRKDLESGFDARSKGALETAIDLNESHTGGLNAQQLRQLAAGRYFRGKNSTTTGARLEQWWSETGKASEEDEQAISAESKKIISKSEELTKKFYAQSRLRRFQAARETARQANDELPGTLPNGMTPEIAYKQYLTGAMADRQWVISMSPRAGTREFEH